MLKSLTIISLAITVSGCASNPPDWVTGSNYCKTIGCGKDLSFYPMAPGEAVRQAEAHGFQYGKTSSAYAPTDPRHHELRKAEEAAGETPWHWNQPTNK